MPRVRRRNAYQHVSAFDRGRIVAYRDCGLSHRSVAAIVEIYRDPMTVLRIWNRWLQETHTECHTGSHRSPIIDRREDRHVIRKVLTDRKTTSRIFSQEMRL